MDFPVRPISSDGQFATLLVSWACPRCARAAPPSRVSQGRLSDYNVLYAHRRSAHQTPPPLPVVSFQPRLTFRCINDWLCQSGVRCQSRPTTSSRSCDGRRAIWKGRLRSAAAAGREFWLLQSTPWITMAALPGRNSLLRGGRGNPFSRPLHFCIHPHRNRTNTSE